MFHTRGIPEGWRLIAAQEDTTVQELVAEAVNVLFQAPHETAVAMRTLLSYRSRIKGREFIQRVSELGAARAGPVRVEAKRGKGSHITLYYGPRKTVVTDLRKEIAPGLLSAMLRQLGLTRRDFRRE